MKTVSIALGLAFGLGACSAQSEEDQLEKLIRETLAKQGEVQQVELTRQANGSMAGFVIIREPNGRVGRLTCSAEPAGDAKYNWKCTPAIDEKTLKEMEGAIRAELSKRGPVGRIEMKRQDDDDHMSGFAMVRNEAGDEVRLACSASRNAGASFSWKCGEDGEE